MDGDSIDWRRKRRQVDMNWAMRSCHFEFLCFDMTTHEFNLYLSKSSHSNIPKHMESQQTVFFNQSVEGYPFGVSIGGINTKWTLAGYSLLQWFPKIIYDSPPTHFYTLPSNVTMIPFHSLAGFNPGHLVWDDFLPIHTLMHIFGLDDTTDPLLIRYELAGNKNNKTALWATCDWGSGRKEECEIILKKFGRLMMQNTEAIPITTQHSWRLHLYLDDGDTNTHNNSDNADDNSPKEQPKSNLICARHGLAGLGALTDHGIDKGHGWEQKDYETMHNHGRGGQLWRFRNFMMKRLNLPITTTPPLGPPYRIIFSERSSDMGSRSIDFNHYVGALQATVSATNATTTTDHTILQDIEILHVRMKDFSLHEQAEMVSKAAIYVTACGGGAVTATFLPRGASLLIYYDEVGGFENSRFTGKPARLDWDYFNNMAYARVHWLTQPKLFSLSSSLSTNADINIFIELVKHELALIQAQQIAYQDQQE